MLDSSSISRRVSVSKIVNAISHYGPTSRASVAKITGLSKQTVSEIVSGLEGSGWVRTVGRTEGHVGRRAVVYEISPDAAAVASVDLGGFKTRVAICDLTGVVIAETVRPTDRKGGEAVVRQIADLIRSTTRKAGLTAEKVHSAVVGVPGAPDPTTGRIGMVPNIPGLDRIDMRHLLQDSLGIEAVVENDVNLAALGEHWLVRHSENDDLVYVSIGTGIGAGLVVGGRLLRGAFGSAGEVGYLPFGTDPFDEGSKKAGALERVAASRAIMDGYANLTGTAKTVPEVFDAAREGDSAAVETLDGVAKQIARALAAIVSVVDPSCVVIGGSIGSRDELLRPVRRFLAECFPRPIRIEKSLLGQHAAVAGGAAIALSRLHLAVFAGGLAEAELDVPPPEIESFMSAAA